MSDWERIRALLVELANEQFCVFGVTDEAAEIVDRLIEIAVEETLQGESCAD